MVDQIIRNLEECQGMANSIIGDYDKRIAQLEAELKQRPSIKVSDGDVWLVFPNVLISIDRILASKPGPIVERNIRKWRDDILEGK